MNFTPIPDDVLDEIVAGAGGVAGDKADNAVAFLDEMSMWLAEVIKVIKEFFDRLIAELGAAE